MFKRIISLLLAICISGLSYSSIASATGVTNGENQQVETKVSDSNITVWDGSIAKSFAGGTGTQDDPYLISNGSELAYLAQEVDKNISYKGKYFQLTQDIVLNDYTDWENWSETNAPKNTWNPIGNDRDSYTKYRFMGKFDGRNHKIWGMYTTEGGLFANVGLMSEIKNLGIEASYIYSTSGYYAGGIAGRVADAKFENCYNAGTVVGEWIVGGIVGYQFSSCSIINCYNRGDVICKASESYPCVGGIVGYGSHLEIESCVNLGEITGKAEVGGIAGRVSSPGTISNCINKGTIRGTNEVGGILGYALSDDEAVAINNCENYANVIGDTRIGGIVGYCYASESVSVDRCANYGEVSGTSYVSGILGYGYAHLGNIYMKNSYNIAAISGSNYVSGILGLASNNSLYKVIISTSYNIGTIISEGNSGALIANKNHTSVNNTYYLESCGGTVTAGQSLTTEQMADESSFEGFDFENVWRMDTERGVPVLINDSLPTIPSIPDEGDEPSDIPSYITKLCYIGPGTNYQNLGNLDFSEIKPICKENGFYEVEAGNQRVYISAEEFEQEYDVPVVRNLSSTAYQEPGGNTLYKVNVDFISIIEIDVYGGPSAVKYTKRDSLPAGTPIKIIYLCQENSTIFDDYYLVEYQTDEGLKRGYISYYSYAQNQNHPLRYFDNVKSANGCFQIEGKNVYSASSSIDRSSDNWNLSSADWKVESTYSLTNTQYDIWGGIVGLISANEAGAEVDWGGGNPYYNPDSASAKGMDLASSAIEMTTGFLKGLIKNTYYKVCVEEFDNERRLIIFTGTPMEAAYAGKTMSLASLLAKPGSYLTSEDEWIRKQFDGLKDYGEYSMNITMSDDFSVCPYGNSIVIKNDGSVWAYPIIHSGTTMPVYHTYNGRTTFEFDAAQVYAKTAFVLDDNTAQILFDELREAGIESSYGQTSVKCPVDISVYDADNNLVAQTEDGYVSLDIEDDLSMDVISDAKIIRYPVGQEYSIEATAYDDGTMEYIVSEYEDCTVTNRAAKNNVPLNLGAQFKGSISENRVAKLHDSGGAELLSVQMNDSPSEDVAVDVSATTGGTVIGIPSIIKRNDVITLTAVESEGYDFEGWYKNGMYWNNSKQITFATLANLDVEARFCDTDPEVASIQIHQLPRRTAYYVGEEVSYEGLTLAVSYTDGTVRYIDQGIECSEVTIEQIGSVSVEVGYQGHTLSFEVTGKKANTIESVEFSKEVITLNVGDTHTLNAKVIPNDLKENLIWLSEDESIATVDQNGVVNAVAAGNTRIVAVSYSGGKTAQKDVKVLNATHTYGNPEFTWNKDGTCTAFFTCVDGDDVQTVTCTVIKTTVPAKCTENGKDVFTASAVFQGKTYTDSKETVITAGGHSYTDGVCGICGEKKESGDIANDDSEKGNFNTNVNNTDTQKTKSGTDGENVKQVKSGDENDLGIWIALLFLSSFAIVATKLHFRWK